MNESAAVPCFHGKIFQDSLQTPDHFPKIFQRLCEGHKIVLEVFRSFPKKAEKFGVQATEFEVIVLLSFPFLCFLLILIGIAERELLHVPSLKE